MVGLLAIAGLVYTWREQRWYFGFTVVAFALTGLIFQFLADVNLSNSTGLFVLERFFLLPLVFIAPLAGLGVAQLAELGPRLNVRAAPAAVAISVIVVVAASAIAALNYGRIDLSN